MNKLQTILNGSNNSITELFEWDPTEKVATRPMFMQYRVPGQTYALFYTHDGNKNVSEVVHFSRANGVAAHYEYAPFGEETAQVRQGGIAAYDFAALNPWRFSIEYADDDTGLIYYNYRYYDAMSGRWKSMDPVYDFPKYVFLANDPLDHYDVLGLKDDYLPDVPEVAPELGVSYQFDSNELAKHLANVSVNLNKHRHENQEEPKCPEPRYQLALGFTQWRLVTRRGKTDMYDYPLFNQRMHIEFDAANAFTIGGGYSGRVWGISGTRRVEERNHVSIVGLIEVNQRVVVKSYEWNCECISSPYGSNNGHYYYPSWRTYYEDPSYYYVGKWLAAVMSVTSMDGKNSWSVEGQVGGFRFSYGEEK